VGRVSGSVGMRDQRMDLIACTRRRCKVYYEQWVSDASIYTVL
jgi:hypothetical protein